MISLNLKNMTTVPGSITHVWLVMWDQVIQDLKTYATSSFVRTYLWQVWLLWLTTTILEGCTESFYFRESRHPVVFLRGNIIGFDRTSRIVPIQ